MPKRADHFSDLLAIGIFTPMVVAARLQRLATERARPTANGRRETTRMIAEKPAAIAEGAVAAQKSLFDSGLKFWSDMSLAANAFALTAPALSMSAATAPARRRVRANARRLAKS